MSHRTLRSAVIALLASVPLLAAVPAQAAARQTFPCAVGIQKLDNTTTSTVTVNIYCAQAQSVAVTITAGGAVLLSAQEAVQANVGQTVTVTAPRVPRVCATLRTGTANTMLCTP
ncbi:hypothetical protein [Streptomyces cyanogenus]|uniref:Uncharacterized protein n=1 Tax=Streptomyces cyanogenus TaxID=80860 RepID=A0ABX7TSQ8_STRCY|nr:hypothetical protein [Streptomyces cyanogenus]QTD98653.1 hypothetical protein S1361_14950 [Streptomyces cyanogenus]